MNCLLDIQTTQLNVFRVFDTGTQVWGLTIYGIVNGHRNGKRTNYRFGTMAQVISILKTYRFSVLREYQKDYDRFILENDK